MSGVLVLGQKAYAIELIWRTAEETSVSARELARTEAKDLGCDLFTAREGDPLVIALGDSRKGHKRGMPVLAFSLLDQFVGSVIAAFRTEEGIYVIGTRDDLVISGIENLYQDEDEARSIFLDLAQRSSWNRVIAPKSWNIQDSEEQEITSILAESVNTQKLRSIARTREYIAIGMVVAAFLSCIGFWWYMEQERFNRFMEEQNLRLFAEQAAREERRRRALTQTFPDPSWAGKPSFAAALALCIDGIRSLPIHVPGWTATSVDCIGAESLRVTYNRQDGPVTMFDVAIANMTTKPRMTWQGNQVILDWPMRPAVPAVSAVSASAPSSAFWRGDVQTRRLSDARMDITKRLEDMFIFMYQVNEQMGQPVPVLSPDGEQIAATLEQGLRVSFRANLSHVPMLMKLGEGQVSTLNVVSYDLNSGSMRIELTVHERLGMPGLNVPGVPVMQRGPQRS